MGAKKMYQLSLSLCCFILSFIFNFDLLRFPIECVYSEEDTCDDVCQCFDCRNEINCTVDDIILITVVPAPMALDEMETDEPIDNLMVTAVVLGALAVVVAVIVAVIGALIA